MTLSTRFNRPRSMRWLAPSPLDLFQEFEQFLQPWSGLTRGNIGVYHPIDLYETDDAVVLEMAVPGIAAEDLDLSIEGRQVTIRGRSAEVEADEDRHYWLRGMPRGEFSRTVTVPSGIDANAIQATVDQGVLRLRMPKAPEARARKIAVSGAGRAEDAKALEAAHVPVTAEGATETPEYQGS
ncbi:MAG TPA: Hsp20/alpha crystallin family protein [Trueperaceae bacterium]|nr:Hsp20/alpha crystallin family protein [Trueperaceae bacterium]